MSDFGFRTPNTSAGFQVSEEVFLVLLLKLDDDVREEGKLDLGLDDVKFKLLDISWMVRRKAASL